MGNICTDPSNELKLANKPTINLDRRIDELCADVFNDQEEVQEEPV